MIKFFRHIRYNLMEQNKTGKYLKYAIGEIILVVIGILIALQINNWNEDQKANHRQSLVLKELVNSINNDLSEYEKYLDPRLKKKKSGLDSLQAYILGNKKIEDSLFFKFFNKIQQDVHFRYGNGPFEALKSSGLDLIRNDALRSQINNTYTGDLPNVVLFANELYYETKPKIDELYYKFIGIKPIYLEDGTKALAETLIVDDILNNQDFLLAFHLEKNKYEQYISRLEQIRSILLGIKSVIEKELNK
ncbi:DUF6090 family protein [Hanstruepera marina]|uniref:DUF6090 family protein n=1 Tax=Hanstruepera marina TaxID=2873265 RepID=UPI001CA6D3CC|nr:DUF6090 family protein [Hanstruepera marina]